MRYHTYLFDLDGTLLDTIGLIHRSFREAARNLIGVDLSTNMISSVMGSTLEDAFAALLGPDAPIESLVATYRRINLELHDDMVRPYPGIVECIDGLKRAGAALGIVTTKLHEDAKRGLRVTGLDSVFPVVVGRDHVTRFKPDPEPVRLALSQLGAGPQHALFVGDSPHDLRAGRSAGVGTAAVLWGGASRRDLEPHQPDHWIERAEQIMQLATL